MMDNGKRLKKHQRNRFERIANDAAQAAIKLTLDPSTPHIAFFSWNAHVFGFDMSIRASATDYQTEVFRASTFMYFPEVDQSLAEMSEQVAEFQRKCALAGGSND